MVGERKLQCWLMKHTSKVPARRSWDLGSGGLRVSSQRWSWAGPIRLFRGRPCEDPGRCGVGFWTWVLEDLDVDGEGPRMSELRAVSKISSGVGSRFVCDFLMGGVIHAHIARVPCWDFVSFRPTLH